MVGPGAQRLEIGLAGGEPDPVKLIGQLPLRVRQRGRVGARVPVQDTPPQDVHLVSQQADGLGAHRRL
jgi:hypothetical protein